MARKSSTTTNGGAPKTRKPRTQIEKVFVVATNPPRLVAGMTQRKVEAAVWQKPTVRIATPTDLRELTACGVLIETIEASPPTRIDAPLMRSNGATETAAEAAAS